MWRSKNKGSKKNSQNMLWLPMPEGREP